MSFEAYDESHKSWLESIGIDQNAALFRVSHDYEKINEEYQQRKELLGRDTTSKKGDDDDHESGTANYSSGSGDPPPHSRFISRRVESPILRIINFTNDDSTQGNAKVANDRLEEEEPSMKSRACSNGVGANHPGAMHLELLLNGPP